MAESFSLRFDKPVAKTTYDANFKRFISAKFGVENSESNQMTVYWNKKGQVTGIDNILVPDDLVGLFKTKFSKFIQ